MRIRREDGVISIETTVCLSLFLFAFLSIISLAKIAKVESMTQYAIDQVAKEMSKYYYIASKVGVGSASGQSAGDLDQTVSSIFDFLTLYIFIKAIKKTMIDNGSSMAVKKATSRYLNVAMARNSPASKTETMMTLSNGFVRRTTPIAPIIIKAIDIVVMLISSSIQSLHKSF